MCIIVPCDDPDEYLYLRIKPDEILGTSVVPAVVSFPDWSTNRQRFSRPEEVLDSIRYPLHTRIAELRIGDIPATIPPDPPRAGEAAPVPWCFQARHVPIKDHAKYPDNYAHTEVQQNKQGEAYVRNAKPNSSEYRKKVRMQMAGIVHPRPAR
jgi:hypothetical protein